MVIRRDEEMIVNGELEQIGVGFRGAGKRGEQHVAVFRCRCGRHAVIVRKKVKRGETKSCGCLCRRKEHNDVQHEPPKLGWTAMKQARASWRHMKARCENNTINGYHRYGGRGITIDAAWQRFEKFIEDMGLPEFRQTIDRKDNNQGYSAENCRWATRVQQNCNRRSTRHIEYQGERLCIKHWANRTGIAEKTIRKRLNAGMPPEKIFGRR